MRRAYDLSAENCRWASAPETAWPPAEAEPQVAPAVPRPDRAAARWFAGVRSSVLAPAEQRPSNLLPLARPRQWRLEQAPVRVWRQVAYPYPFLPTFEAWVL